MSELFDTVGAPQILIRARALLRIDSGEAVDAVAASTNIARRHLLVWHQAIECDGLAAWLGKREPSESRIRRARSGIAQMLLGQLAEEHFETLSRDVLGAQGFRVEDQRIGRTDTDYRLLDPDERPICRLNIKCHGTLFKQAAEYVNLLRERLFERVHALRLRGFNQLFRGAEINMHLSLSNEMIAYRDFRKILAGRGSLEMARRRDRGEI